MLESSVIVDASVEPSIVGPDYFGFYVSELVGLLSGCKDMRIPSQASDDETAGGFVGGNTTNNGKHNKEGHLFFDSIGTSLPELIRERLHSLLRQSVTVLSQEVDEVVDPVFSICRLKKECLRYKKSLANAASDSSEIDNDDPPLKRVRLSISSAPLCNSNGSAPMESPMVESDTAIQKENREIDDELQLLLESDSSEVEQVMKRHADEYQAKIEHMESMLEKLLHIVTSTCRSMTRPEKHTLKKLIRNLPPENLERIAEIIQHSRPVVDTPFAEMHIDLEKEDNVTLWRLYYYVKAVERAQQQCVTHH